MMGMNVPAALRLFFDTQTNISRQSSRGCSNRGKYKRKSVCNNIFYYGENAETYFLMGQAP